jgi:hypothetical protein
VGSLGIDVGGRGFTEVIREVGLIQIIARLADVDTRGWMGSAAG